MMPENSEFGSDFLTGFNTRESLNQTIKALISNYENSKKAFSIILIDIDFFKTFNDKYGHLLGDEVLKYFSSSIRLDMVAKPATFFRFGGDELLIVLHASDSHEASQLGNRLLENIKNRPCNLRGNQLLMSFSAGVASYPSDGRSLEELLENADKALYISKRNGRGQVTQYSQIWLKKAKKVGQILSIFLVIGFILLAVRLNFKEKVSSGVRGALETTLQLEKSFFDQFGGLQEKLKGKVDALQNPVSSEDYLEKIISQGKENDSAPKTVEVPIEYTPPPDLIYLKSGGIVKGSIVLENETQYKVQLSTRSGKASIWVEKDTVERVERAKQS